MNDQLKGILEQQLRDVQTPDSISWWPLAIGWWIVIGLIVIVLTAGIIALIRHRQRNSYRKLAVSSLNQHHLVWQTQKNDADYLQAANTVLKRACLHFNDGASTLSNNIWVDFLNDHSKNKLSHATEVALTQQLYQANPSVDINSLHTEVKTWLLKHTIVPTSQTNKSTDQSADQSADQSTELKHA